MCKALSYCTWVGNLGHPRIRQLTSILCFRSFSPTGTTSPRRRLPPRNKVLLTNQLSPRIINRPNIILPRVLRHQTSPVALGLICFPRARLAFCCVYLRRPSRSCSRTDMAVKMLTNSRCAAWIWKRLGGMQEERCHKVGRCRLWHDCRLCGCAISQSRGPLGNYSVVSLANEIVCATLLEALT